MLGQRNRRQQLRSERCWMVQYKVATVQCSLFHCCWWQMCESSARPMNGGAGANYICFCFSCFCCCFCCCCFCWLCQPNYIFSLLRHLRLPNHLFTLPPIVFCSAISSSESSQKSKSSDKFLICCERQTNSFGRSLFFCHQKMWPLCDWHQWPLTTDRVRYDVALTLQPTMMIPTRYQQQGSKGKSLVETAGKMSQLAAPLLAVRGYLYTRHELHCKEVVKKND